jgi:hypothetical protein
MGILFGESTRQIELGLVLRKQNTRRVRKAPRSKISSLILPASGNREQSDRLPREVAKTKY